MQAGGKPDQTVGTWAFQPVVCRVATQPQAGGGNPYAYLKKVLTRLPTQRANDVSQLLPHRWRISVPMGERCLGRVINRSNYFHRSFSVLYWISFLNDKD